jgi:putative spermidine/putrescine transport system permease protein
MRSWLRGGGGGTGRTGTGTRLFSWVVLVLGILYFFLPLLATFLHSIKPRPNDIPDPTLAYRQVLADERFYVGLGYSFAVGVITIVLSLLIIVPTAYWVRLRAPRRWSSS